MNAIYVLQGGGSCTYIYNIILWEKQHWCSILYTYTEQKQQMQLLRQKSGLYSRHCSLPFFHVNTRQCTYRWSWRPFHDINQLSVPFSGLHLHKIWSELRYEKWYQSHLQHKCTYSVFTCSTRSHSQTTGAGTNGSVLVTSAVVLALVGYAIRCASWNKSY